PATVHADTLACEIERHKLLESAREGVEKSQRHTTKTCASLLMEGGKERGKRKLQTRADSANELPSITAPACSVRLPRGPNRNGGASVWISEAKDSYENAGCIGSLVVGRRGIPRLGCLLIGPRPNERNFALSR